MQDLKIVNKNMAFLFTDIRGFTSLCEGMPPKQIVEIINHYLEVQTEIILKYKGDIDKFVGDEIMAVFEGEDKEINACRASLELKNVLVDDKIFREKRGNFFRFTFYKSLIYRYTHQQRYDAFCLRLDLVKRFT